MDFEKNLPFSYKIITAYFFLHFISFGLFALNYVYLLSNKRRTFIISFLSEQIILLLIFMSKLISLLKLSDCLPIDQVKYYLKIFIYINSIFYFCSYTICIYF